MGTIKADTLTGLSAASDVTIASNKFIGTASGTMTVVGEGGTNQTSLQQGLTKAWTNYNGVANSIRDSFNTSSVTDVATGKYGIVMSTAMANILYCPTVYSNSTNGDSFYGGGRAGVKNTEFVSDSTTQYEVVSYSNDYIDATRNYTAVDGDLG